MAVLRRPAQPDTERASERGLDHARIGAGVFGRVTRPGPQRAIRRPAHQWRTRHHQCPGHPGTDIVRDVIRARRRPAEARVTRRPVTDHRVQRVGAPVEQHPGRTTEGRPQQRCDLGVRGVLRDRFQCGTGQPVDIEQCGVATTQRRQQRPRAGDIARVEQVGHRQPGARQRRAAQRCPGCRRDRRRRPEWAAAPGTPLDRDRTDGKTPQQRRDVQRTRSPGVAIRGPFQPGRQRAETRNGMAAARVGKHSVGQPSDQHPRGPARPSPACRRNHPGSVSQVVYPSQLTVLVVC